MKITIDIEVKEIAELRTLPLSDERLIDSKIADAKKQLVDEIASAVSTATPYHTKFWQEHGTEKPCQARC